MLSLCKLRQKVYVTYMVLSAGIFVLFWILFKGVLIGRHCLGYHNTLAPTVGAVQRLRLGP